MRWSWVPLIMLVAASACSEPRQLSEGSPEAAPSPSSTPSTVPASSTEPTPDLSAVRIRPVEVATLEQPLALATRPGDPTLYVGQKTGQVVAVRDGRVETILDLSEEVSQGFEQGLLGLAFSPDGRFLYVNFTDVDGDTHITEFAFRNRGLDGRSRRDILVVDQPFSNHNGGNLVFGPDGYLYIGLGDGGGAGDPFDNAQSLGNLLGKMLRIDPRPFGGRPYSIPRDNPFVEREGARPEIWTLGLRNPWRYSFDRETGDLWIGDVGQSAREEIDLLPAGSGAGANLGWNGFEGSAVFQEPTPRGAIPPVHEYGPSQGASVIGGFVYRGQSIPELRGAYLFGDFYNPAIRALVPRQDGSLKEVPLGVEVEGLAAFGEDQEGELYALSLSGGVYRLST
jgi:glucose/arabinose dehydrogenase